MATTFGVSVKKALLDMGKTQEWLCEQVRSKTGLYCDSGVLSKLLYGKYTSKNMSNAICEILGIENSGSG